MEKFAVDLDKVLDEFEFNEDRAEQLANVLPKRRAVPAAAGTRHHPSPAPPPYRRAPFEPVSLADADYAASDVPRSHGWNVQNTLRRPGGGDTGGDSSPPPPYTPNNINETTRRGAGLGYYENNSFKDESSTMEHKPTEQIAIEPAWLRKCSVAAPNKKAAVNVSGVFSSLNEYVNAGSTTPKVKDVKTVSNDLTPNRVKNSNPEGRNLPDVASTPGRPRPPRNPAGDLDLPGVNNTFDLVTNLGSERRVPPRPAAEEDETSVGEALESVEALNDVFKTFEIGNIKNITTDQPSVDDIPNVADVEKVTSAETVTSQSEIESEETAIADSDGKTTAGEVETKPAVGFKPDEELSDAMLLTYLGDMERELEDDVVKPSDDAQLTRNLDIFCDNLNSRAAIGDEADEDETDGTIEGKNLADEPDSGSNAKCDDATAVSPVRPSGEYKSMHSAIRGDERFASDAAESIAETSTPSDPSTNVDSTAVEESPESERPGDRSTEDFDSDATSTTDEDEGGGGISADAAATLEMQADAKRAPIVEVRSPMVQSPRDGNAIHVLGEEERPTRPKYLFLPSKITMGNNGTSEEGEASSDDEGTPIPPASQVGPAGATPHAHPTAIGRDETTDNNLTSLDEENRNTIIADETTSTAADEERLDNRTNADDVAAVDADANLSSPDYSESSVETPPPVSLPPPDPATSLTDEDRTLGFVSPFWVPDNEAGACMLCDARFTVLRRRHHCRACGKVLCSKCCGLKARLEYLDNAEGRVCQPCHDILLRVLLEEHGEMAGSPTRARQPHPNNPMDYCSTIPPLQQVAGALHNPTPSVLVPVGVLKRQGSNRPKSEVAKQVMFSDGIRPGGDLTELDGSGEPRIPFRRPGRVAKRVATPPGPVGGGSPRSPLPPLDPKTLSYIPSDRGLPPVATLTKGELRLDDDMDEDILLTALRADDEPPVMFAINRNLYVNVKILNLSCCVNRLCWCFSTQGLRCVSQDEIMLVLETLPNELMVPRDIFCYFNTLYQDAVKGSTVSDLGCTLLTGPFLGSTDHGAFVYIRPSFQCLRRFILPTAPYLVAILVHRSETPWARVFPIRLVLRLGAEFRYYPCSLVSVRNRKSVYHDIGHTIMNLLADFRNLSYTLPSVRGLVIHMEDRRTTILLPKNRYDQVTRALNNSNEHVLALAANLSLTADSHLVCVQSSEDLSYHTQAINIHSKPRRVTGASFVVFNGALKTSSNLTAKSSIVEDGLMVQITPDTMLALRGALRNMKDWSVGCGPTGAPTPDETVSVQWVDDDKNFNVGVCSVIDGRCLDGVPSIRVHNGTDYLGRSRLVRWTEVFILKSDEGGRTGDPLDVGRLSESIARAVCHALVKLLDLLAQADYNKFAIRASVHPDNVCYEGGSRGETLPPIYMNSLDNELVPVLHAAATANENTSAMLELVFHVLLQ